MRTTIDLGKETGNELTHVVGLTREKQAVVLRQAIRLGLPLLANRLQAPRPDGYLRQFGHACGTDLSAYRKAAG